MGNSWKDVPLRASTRGLSDGKSGKYSFDRLFRVDNSGDKRVGVAWKGRAKTTSVVGCIGGDDEDDRRDDSVSGDLALGEAKST